MRFIRLVFVGLLGFNIASAQLTMDQKISDFQHLASVFAKRYSSLEWKREVVQFDLLNLSPWLDKVRATKSDLDYFEVASEYVSSLNDAHDTFYLPSTFVARLNFGVDLYDGKLLVDGVDRNLLPADQYGFSVGWELVSIDGHDAQTLLASYQRYAVAANPRSTRRWAAQFLTTRPQQLIPAAPNVGDNADVIFRRPDGQSERFRIPWVKTGLALETLGQYPTPKEVMPRSYGEAAADPMLTDEEPGFVRFMRGLQHTEVRNRAIAGYGSVVPVFANSMPKDFVVRLGSYEGDPFYSGTFSASGYRIGYIRVPHYGPSDTVSALNAFAREIAYFQANTDGLIVDEMRNPGGYVDYANQITSFLMKGKWRAIGFEIRPTLWWVVSASSYYEQAKAFGYTGDQLAPYKELRDEVVAANREGRRTKPLGLDLPTLDRDPAKDARGNVIAYTKPMMMLIDEMSASGGDAVAAMFQDARRGVTFGWRTMGAGGSVEEWAAGSYSQGNVSVTVSLMSRANPVSVAGYPSTTYVENVGVHPDIAVDYMTIENLKQDGRPYVDAFVAAMVDHIRESR